MENLTAIKREVVATTNTQGWHYIVDLSERVVQQMERAAIDEEDDTKGAVLRRQAKAAREFLKTLLQMIEAHRYVEVESGPDDGLVTY